MALSQPRTLVREVAEFMGMLLVIFLIRTFIFGLYFVPSGSMEHTLLVGDSLVTDKLTVWFTPIKRGEVIAFNQPTYAYSKKPIMNFLQRYVLGIFWGPQNWTKRVIAIAGDTIEGKIEDGKTVIYLNGQKLDEPYVNTYPLAIIHKTNMHLEQARALGIEPQYDLISWDPTLPGDKQPFYPNIPSDRFEVIPAHAGIDSALTGQLLLIYPRTPFPVGPTGSRDIFKIVIPNGFVWCMGDNRNGSHDSRADDIGPVPTKLIHGRVRARLFSFYDVDSSWMVLSLLKDPLNFFSKFRWNRFFQMIR
jgi:signal peptidase I